MYKISKDDWQYCLPFLICLFSILLTDLFRYVDKIKFAYWSGILIDEPYRILTSHFLHSDIKHFLINTFGIIFARYCFKALRYKGSYLFILLIILIIPLQTIIFWAIDILIFQNEMSLAIGFSGLIYGINAFILLASYYGKRKFIGISIYLEKNHQIHQLIVTMTLIGFIFSLLPGISLAGHLAGFISGSMLFLF